MKSKELERVVQLFFTYDNVEYKFDEDKIYYKSHGNAWFYLFELPISITDYAYDINIVKVMCVMGIQGYLKGFSNGKDSFKKELREFIGIYN